MADELLSVLTRFHREILVSDMEQIVNSRITPLRDDVLSDFDATYRRFERLEVEYLAIVEALKRLEAAAADTNRRFGKHPFRSENHSAG